MGNYLRLQNGSDIRGIAISGVAGEDVNLKPEEARNIAIGFLKWLNLDKKTIRIAIGRDPRLSGQALLEGLSRGLNEMGTKVYDCGLASTPAMFMATIFDELNCDGAIMITASHLPYNRNGFKFFTRNGGLNKKDITEILNFAKEEEKVTDVGQGMETVFNEVDIVKDTEMTSNEAEDKKSNIEKTSLMSIYCSHLKEIIKRGINDGERPLENIKIVIDAGNGGGGFFANDVLKPLGADVSASQFLDPDGNFPNHAPNPENKEAREAISKQVIESKADFGIIFDTDVDRSSAIDENGQEIARNAIVAMAGTLVAEDHPNSTVVTDSITSNQLTKYLEEELGLRHFRYQRGYKNVINKAIELNEEGIDCQLAIETSGHAALKENYFLDDGAYLAAKIVVKTAQLIKEGKRLSSVLEKLEEPREEMEVRIPIKDDNFSVYADNVLKELSEFAKKEVGMKIVEPNYEGVKIDFEKESGWCLLRKSLHDPLMPMNISSDIIGGCEKIKQKMYDFLKQHKGLKL